jgi:hypothetical protein
LATKGRKPRQLKPIKTATGRPTWVEQWQEKIVADGGLPGAAREELFKTTQELTDILKDKLTSVQDRCIKGMVVGNVQSGKTASMIGVTAAAFDLGVDIVVILTGTDNTLREQTHSRFNFDLFQYNDEIKKSDGEPFDPPRKANPGPVGKQAGTIQEFYPMPYQTSLTEFLNRGDASATLFKSKAKGQKVQITALKNRKLADLGNVIRNTNEILALAEKENLKILVLDDEADFASAPGSEDAGTQFFIQDLWVNQYVVEISGLEKEIEVFPDKNANIVSHTESQVIYLGYTATPQGMVKNRFNNILKPEDFIYTLRSSGGYHDDTDLEPSERVYYTATNPVREWYCGGHVYYRWLENEQAENFLFKPVQPIERATSLIPDGFTDALCDYFVSGAIRWMEDGFDKNAPITHTMFIHNHANTYHHFGDMMSFILWLYTNVNGGEEHVAFDQRKKFIKSYKDVKSRDGKQSKFKNLKSIWGKKGREFLIIWLESDEGKEKLTKSYETFVNSRETLLNLFPGVRRNSDLPPFDDDLMNVIFDVIRQTKLRFINGDGCLERLNFDKTYNLDDDSEIVPFDAFSIVIGGNMLGRGVTLKNLAVTYFQKDAATKSQDTYIQRQRWFGYRGNMIEFCRLYAPNDTIEFLLNAHNDLENMIDYWAGLNEQNVPLDDARWWSLTTSDGDLISRKSVDGRSVQFDHWVYPTTLIESPNLDGNEALRGNSNVAKANYDHQINMMKRVIEDGRKIDQSDLPNPGKPTKFFGYLMGEPLNTKEKAGKSLSAVDLAEFLDGFTFTNHHPDPNCPIISSFDSIAQRLGLSAGELHSHFNHLGNHRNAMIADDDLVTIGMKQNPYLIAAYLRYWDEMWKKSQSSEGIPSGIVADWDPIEPPNFNVVVSSNSKKYHTFVEIEDKAKNTHSIGTYGTPLNQNGITRSHFIGLPKNQSNFGGWANLDDFRTATWSGESERKQVRPAGTNGIVVLRLADKGPKDKDNTPMGVSDAEHRPKIWINIPKGGPKLNFV